MNTKENPIYDSIIDKITNEKTFVTPKWVYEEPKYHGAGMRITPLLGRFKDADWVEPCLHGWSRDNQKVDSISANGGIRSINRTPLSCFEKPGYVLWRKNPTPKTLFQFLFGTKYAYWVPSLY